MTLRTGKGLFRLLVLLQSMSTGLSWSVGGGGWNRPNPTTNNHPYNKETNCLDANRRNVCTKTAMASLILLLGPAVVRPVEAATTSPTAAKCTDIESCREIGERKEAALLQANPIVRLGKGLNYKVLNTGVGDEIVTDQSKVKIIYSISQANGRYMYSKGFGYNQLDMGLGNNRVTDKDLDALLVDMERNEVLKAVPVGIQKALLGMRRGERRRIECPPALGFETSDWNPKPQTWREQRILEDYKALIEGRNNVPPYPAPTIWDVEVVSIRG